MKVVNQKKMKKYESCTQIEKLILYVYNAMVFGGSPVTIKNDAYAINGQITQNTNSLRKLLKSLVMQKIVQPCYPKKITYELNGYKMDDDTIFTLTAKGHTLAEKLFKSIYGDNAILCGWPI